MKKAIVSMPLLGRASFLRYPSKNPVKSRVSGPENARYSQNILKITILGPFFGFHAKCGLYVLCIFMILGSKQDGNRGFCSMTRAQSAKSCVGIIKSRGARRHGRLTSLFFIILVSSSVCQRFLHLMGKDFLSLDLTHF